MGAGSRGSDIDSTDIQASSNNLQVADPQLQGANSSGNLSDPVSSANLSVPGRSTSPESPNLASPATPLSPSSPAAMSSLAPSGPAALSTPPAASPAFHDAKSILSSNASSPASPLLGNDSDLYTPHNPSTSSPAVHAMLPSGSTAPPTQATSFQSAAEDQTNVSPANISNTMRPIPTGNPNQSNSVAIAAFSPDSAAPLPLPGTAPAPAPASSKAAAAPGDAQAVHELTHADALPVIVLAALLGVAIAALLAGETSRVYALLYCSGFVTTCMLRCLVSAHADHKLSSSQCLVVLLAYSLMQTLIVACCLTMAACYLIELVHSALSRLVLQL